MSNTERITAKDVLKKGGQLNPKKETDVVRQALEEHREQENKPYLQAEEKKDKYGNMAEKKVSDTKRVLGSFRDMHDNIDDMLREKRAEANKSFIEAARNVNPVKALKEGSKASWRAVASPVVGGINNRNLNRRVEDSLTRYYYQRDEIVDQGKNSLDKLPSLGDEEGQQRYDPNASSPSVWRQGLERELQMSSRNQSAQSDQTRTKPVKPTREKERKKGQSLEDMDLDDI